MQPNDNSYCIESSFIWVLKSNHITFPKGQTRWQRQKLIDFILQCTLKTKFLVKSSDGLFQTPSDRISHRIHIDRISCYQLPARSGIFVEAVNWHNGLKFVYPTINLAFLEIIVKVKLHAKIYFQFWMILSPNKLWNKIFFPLLSKTMWSRIDSCYSILFSNLKQKKNTTLL